MKTITIDAVEYAMLDSLAKKARIRPDEYVKRLIKESYDKSK